MATAPLRYRDGNGSAIYAYQLIFPNGKCYVGISRDPVKRLLGHIKTSLKGSKHALPSALRKYGEPRLKILAKTDSYVEAFALERNYIAQLKTKCPHGYNMTDGGDGVVGLPLEVRQAIGRKLSALYNDPKFRKKMRAIVKASGPKVSAANKAFYATEAGKEVMRRRSVSEWRKNIAEVNRKEKAPATKRKMKRAMKRNWQNPEYRAKVNAAREAKQAWLRMNDPEWVAQIRAKRSVAMKAKWSDPKFIKYWKKHYRKPAPLSKEALAARGKKISASYTDEARTASSARIKALNDAGKMKWTDERRKKWAERMRERWADPQYKLKVAASQAKRKKAK
ncbi:MAG TPA: GIY-YIG nuclease family protein [Candidatus Paceibacterota bacterium]